MSIFELIYLISLKLLNLYFCLNKLLSDGVNKNVLINGFENKESKKTL